MKIGLGQIDMGFEERERAMELCRAILAEAGEQEIGRASCRERVWYLV